MKKIMQYINRYRKPIFWLLISGCGFIVTIMGIYGYRYVRPSEAVVFDAEYVNMFASWTIPSLLYLINEKAMV